MIHLAVWSVATFEIVPKSDFLAASLNLLSSISIYFCSLLLWTLGIKNWDTKFFIMVSLLLYLRSNCSRGLSIFSFRKVVMM